ncbi:MAG: TauD/TfdA family dioxygenase [Pseudomonas sp.]|uniref:TauD/TfdA family dioxygenase n=1 Tax=Pseudomonas sp. TaxID=306 RepID=UPI0033951DEF
MHQNCVFRFADSERELLKSALEKITYDPSGATRYITESRIVGHNALPRRIIDALNEQKASIHPKPYLLFENLPTDHEVFTSPDPKVFTPSAKTGFVSENLVIAFASLIGEPYSIFFEGSDIVNNLVPTASSKQEYTGLGSEVELDFHIENAALKLMGDNNFSPLGLLLTGVRHDLEGPLTRLSDAREALKLLTAADLAALRAPLFKIKVPYRWRQGAVMETEPMAVVQGELAYPEISVAFYPGMITACDDEAAAVLQRFYEAIRAVSIAVDIKPGQLLYIDNRFTLHSRDKFFGTLDPTGRPMRWVQRVFVAPHLWNHRHLTAVKSRVFQPLAVA